jgi:hypothetical protein
MTFEPATGFERSGSIYTRAGYDAIEVLPERAAERLRQLRQSARDQHSLTVPFADRYEMNTTRGDVERRLQRLLAPRSQGGFSLREDDREVVEVRQQLEKLTDETQRLARLDEERSGQWRAASLTLQAVEGWVKNGRPGGTVLQDHEVEPPKLLKNEDLLSALERIRRRGREIKALRHTIQSSCYPSSYCKERARDAVEALAQQGAPNVTNLVEHDRPIEWPNQMLRSDVRGGDHPALAFANIEAATPLLIWLHKDAMIAALDREIDAESDDKSALSHTEREKRLSEVQQDLLEVERQEAAVVWAAMDARLPASHRADCDPLAILQCKLVTAPQTSGSLGTSLQHVIDMIGGRR